MTTIVFHFEYNAFSTCSPTAMSSTPLAERISESPVSDDNHPTPGHADDDSQYIPSSPPRPSGRISPSARSTHSVNTATRRDLDDLLYTVYGSKLHRCLVTQEAESINIAAHVVQRASSRELVIDFFLT
jgi:hypothetical protein